MHFWFNVKKTKNSWLSDVCLFKSSIFPESFFDSNSMDVDQHLGRLAPPLTPGDPAPNNDIQMDKDKDKDKDRGGDSLGNSCKAEPDGAHLFLFLQFIYFVSSRLVSSLWLSGSPHMFLPSLSLVPSSTRFHDYVTPCAFLCIELLPLSFLTFTHSSIHSSILLCILSV